MFSTLYSILWYFREVVKKIYLIYIFWHVLQFSPVAFKWCSGTFLSLETATWSETPRKLSKNVVIQGVTYLKNLKIIYFSVLLIVYILSHFHGMNIVLTWFYDYFWMILPFFCLVVVPFCLFSCVSYFVFYFFFFFWMIFFQNLKCNLIP